MSKNKLIVDGIEYLVEDVTIEREVISREMGPGNIARIPTGRMFFYGRLKGAENEQG